jgi:hypothetical protein
MGDPVVIVEGDHVPSPQDYQEFLPSFAEAVGVGKKVGEGIWDAVSS